MSSTTHRANDRLLAKLVQRSCGFSGLKVESINLDEAKRLKEVELDAIFAASSSYSPIVADALLSIRQTCAFVTKNPSIPGSTDEVRRLKAVDTFRSVEYRQRLVSKRLRWFRAHQARQPVMTQLINMMSLDVFRLLGPAPGLEDYEETLGACNFGPGSVGGRASTGKVVDTTPYGKLAPKTSIWVTERCLRMWGPLIGGTFRQWLAEKPAKVVDACKGTTVPKDSSTDRFIAVEPYLNSWVQLGQMAHLYRKLEQGWGLTLNDQTRNQELAHKASLPENSFPNGWATLDLSSASDSVNTELLKWVLPGPWFAWYNSTRCDHVVLPDGSKIHLEKFSSMGNGNTFALESMLFAAMCRAVRRYVGCDQEYRVYGDDIIISHRCALLLTELLKFCGFQLNGTKSFYFGRFKESCGADFLGGHNVRPIYLKETLSRPAIYKLFNSFQSQRNNRYGALLRESTRDGAIGPSPNPSGITDTHFVAPLDVLRSRRMLKWLRAEQRYIAYHPIERPIRYRISRSDKLRNQQQAYLSALCCSMRSDPHVVRGEVFDFEHLVVRADNLYWLAHYDFSWHVE